MQQYNFLRFQVCSSKVTGIFAVIQKQTYDEMALLIIRVLFSLMTFLKNRSDLRSAAAAAYNKNFQELLALEGVRGVAWPPNIWEWMLIARFTRILSSAPRASRYT